jgi:hypothetical protein
MLDDHSESTAYATSEEAYAANQYATESTADNSTTDADSSTPSAEVSDLMLDTPVLKAEPERPEARIMKVTNAEVFRSKPPKDSIAIKFTFEDAVLPLTYFAFLPKPFVENIGNIRNFDPETLQDGDKFLYRTHVSTSRGTATLQILTAAARAAGRTVNAPVIRSIEDYVDALNRFIAGVEVVVLRDPDNKNEDPQYQGRLRVTGIRPTDVVNNPKALKKYRKSWAPEEQ